MTNGDIWWYLATFHDIWAKNHVVYLDISWHFTTCHDITPSDSERIREVRPEIPEIPARYWRCPSIMVIGKEPCGPSTSSCLSMSKRGDLEHPRAPQLPWKPHLFNKIDWCSWGKAVSAVSWVIHHCDGLKTLFVHKPPWWGIACKVHSLCPAAHGWFKYRNCKVFSGIGGFHGYKTMPPYEVVFIKSLFLDYSETIYLLCLGNNSMINESEVAHQGTIVSKTKPIIVLSDRGGIHRPSILKFFYSS